MKKLFTLLLVLTCYVGTASATDYYIGANTKDNGSNWEIKGQMTDADGDGIYSLIIQVPTRIYVENSDDYFEKFCMTVFTNSSIDWSSAYRPVGGEKWFNNNSNEIELSSNSSLNDKTIGYGNSYTDDDNKNYASALKLDFNPTTMKLTATRLIAIISGDNGYSTTTDYLTETANGSQIYTGDVSLTAAGGGYKYYFHQYGWDYYGRNGGATYMVNTTGSNEVVPEDGIYTMTAQLTDFIWQDPVRVNKTASVTAVGMGTFSSEYALDFTGITDIKAYIISGEENGQLIKTPVEGKVKAETGLFIESANGEAANVDVPTTIYTTDPGTNWLKAVTATRTIPQTDGVGNTNYILTTNGGASATPKFFKVNEAGNEVGAGKAYLQVPETTANEFFWFADDTKEEEEVTAINAIANTVDSNAAMFNLSGQRVNKDYKGVVIQNGKKFIVK